MNELISLKSKNKDEKDSKNKDLANSIDKKLNEFQNLMGKRATLELEASNRWAKVENIRKREEEKSLQLIKDLEAQDMIEREQRRKKAEEDNLSSCDICMDKIEAHDLLPLDKCGHLFHPECIRKYFEGEINERHFPLVCPQCRIEISMLDIKDFLRTSMQEKWDEYTFKKAIDSNPDDFSYCPTPDCTYIFVWDKATDTSDYTCPKCSKHYCLNCRCVYHDGQSCKEYQISTNFTVIYQNIIGRR